MATILAASIISGMNRLFSGLVPVDPYWDEAAYENDRELLQRAAAAAVVPVQAVEKVVLKTIEKSVEAVETTHDALFKLKEAQIVTVLPLPSPTSDEDEDRKCTVCQEIKEDEELCRVACGHEYCEECLQDLFKSSLSNESLFPPRCCRQLVKIEDHDDFLPADIISQYNQKKTEFATTDRTYCWASRCSTFIDIGHINGSVATCPSCELNTCTKCKSQNHQGECKADTEMQPTLEAATENGWKRCFACRRMVELESGCNHMTCLCGAQFCYVCGDQWKTCDCPQFSEGSVPTYDDEIVPPTPNGTRALHVQIADAAARIRNRHECHHDRWARVSGQHLCEQCYQTTTDVVFECQACHTQACGDCSNHTH